MVKTVIVILSFFAFASFGQKGWTCDYNTNDSLRKIVDSIVVLPLPNVLCVDDDVPFLKWKEKPELVTFNLYDRWGSPVLCYDNADMIVTSEVRSKHKIKENQVYFFFIELITKTGKNVRFCGQLSYHGYCRCG